MNIQRAVSILDSQHNKGSYDSETSIIVILAINAIVAMYRSR